MGGGDADLDGLHDEPDLMGVVVVDTGQDHAYAGLLAGELMVEVAESHSIAGGGLVQTKHHLYSMPNRWGCLSVQVVRRYRGGDTTIETYDQKSLARRSRRKLLLTTQT